MRSRRQPPEVPSTAPSPPPAASGLDAAADDDRVAVDGRGEHVVVKPDEIATADKVLTKEEDTLPQERRASKLLRASRGTWSP